MTQITTERLVLRPFLSSDEPRVLAILNDFDVSRWLHRIPHPFTKADLRILGPKGESRWPDLAAIDYGGQLVGGITAGEHLGYWIDPAFQGRGFAREAAHAMVDYYFANTDQDTLASGYFVGNTASEKILTGLGFVQLDVSPHRCEARKTDLPSATMELTRLDWWASHGLPLSDDRISIRPLSNKDVSALQRIAGNNTVAPMLASVKSPWSVKDIKNWIVQGRFRGELGFRLGICDQASGDLIGMVGVGGTPTSLMYFLDEDYWGQGFVTDAAKILLDFVFAKFELAELEADSFTDNPASMRVLEKLGFEKIGTEMANSAARLDPAPVILYRLRREDTESHAS